MTEALERGGAALGCCLGEQCARRGVIDRVLDPVGEHGVAVRNLEGDIELEALPELALGGTHAMVRVNGQASDLDLDALDWVHPALEALAENKVVSCFREGIEPVFLIGPDQQLAAAYYRNTIIHFFVNAAIAELSLLRAADEGVADPVQE